ncbi:P-loop containing nucleoside triphosphate hydrolase protein [Polychytrium aggregatum]|uniref:P-loop containing nucleoside triphosphate hydrolase protein n=1 Tax=Polychytrium aggregatum TaxID=110093 RepID=UPI0022FDC24D|nr:P-loop containing nucleoside triphosphate hydrolase protein [Polychytrium aggregatum]KAI9205349.1 P-loop containing nucleoside triphosphate hydrolase protein [Polychytrium aggregatum]
MNAWNAEITARGRDKASLLRVSWKVFGMDFIKAGLAFLAEAIFKVAQAVFLGNLLVFFQTPGAPVAQVCCIAYGYATALSVCALINAVLHHVDFFLAMRGGMRMRIAFIAAIYRKCLSLSISHTASTGYIVNLVSNDVQRFEDLAPFVHAIWLAPLESVVVLYFLWNLIGWASLVAIAVMLLMIPAQGVIARSFGRIRKDTLIHRDDRIKSLSDMLSGIMIVKLYAWERPFSEKITESRNNEMRHVKKASILRALNEAIFFAASTVVSVCGFITFYFIQAGPFVASRIFTSITLIQVVRLDMTNFFPKALQFGSESLVSLKRIQQFLSLPELGTSRNPEHEKELLGKINNPRARIVFEDASFAWPSSSSMDKVPAVKLQRQESEVVSSLGQPGQKTVLKKLDFVVCSGEVLGVCGPVGSGKTSLLHAILGEMECVSGRSALGSRKIAYATQNPWVVAGTIRDNITFGLPFNPTWFNKVIKACAMDTDIAGFPDRDMTIVGERGVALSGGQKARLALARALYYDADIYVLDDPLSAVDTKVGRHLFEECILGALKDKATVLVTHQLQFISRCSNIMVIEDGSVSTYGSFSAILDNETSKFCGVLRDFSKQPISDDSIDDAMGPASAANSEKIAESLVIEDSSVCETTKPSDLEKPGLANADDSAKPDAIKESAAQGKVSLSVYKSYWTAGASIPSLVGLCMLLFVGEVIRVTSDWWLSHWVQASNNQDTVFWTLYLALGVTTLTIAIIRAIFFFWISLECSNALFRKMLQSVLRAPMYFFNTNPHGRLMNRFSKDLNLADESLPLIQFDFLQCAFMVLGTMVLSIVVIPYVVVLLPPIGIAFYYLRKYYIATSRQVKRLEGITRSPVYATIPATLEGLSTVRAFNAEERFMSRFVHLQNENTTVYFINITAARWLGFRLDFLSAIYLTCVTFLAVGLYQSLNLPPALIGLIMSYVLQLMGMLQWAARQSAETENLMTSVERVVEYTKIESEAPDVTDAKVPSHWPTHGKVDIQDLSLTYPGTNKPTLKNISIVLQPGSKVGIVGRTGAGKSSFLQALFRLVEPTPKGSIRIDDVSTSDLGLTDLRSRISIIPQEPFCFKGTLRFNLDPFGHHDDRTLWRALEAVELKATIEGMPDKMESEVAENGSNWSVGERQLICLARAILRDTKLIVMDEATSSVDLHTDALVQKAIRSKSGMFSNSTVLTIAHRLNTVIDFDYIMVLDQGRLVEFGRPWAMLQKDAGHADAWFARMVNEMGDEARQNLLDIAYQKEQERLSSPEASKSP